MPLAAPVGKTMDRTQDLRSGIAVEAARAALRAGHRAQAEIVLRQRLLDAPADAQCLATLAHILAADGRLAESAGLIRTALEVNPELSPLRFALVRLLQQAESFDEALGELVQLPPALRSELEVRACEAALLGVLGRHADEIAVYELLVRQHPRNADLWKSLANALQTVGRFDDTVRSLRRALRLQPHFGEAWWSLANLKQFRFDARDIAAMDKALQSKLSPVDRPYLHFALGKALEDGGRFEQSFAHYDAGNRIVRAALRPEQTVVTPFVDEALAAYDDGLFERLSNAGEPAPDPIFIVGLQRSGSTLVEQILASHPLVEGTSELRLIPALFETLVNDAGGPAHDIGVAIGSLDGSRCRELGAEYLRRARAHRATGKPLFIDKQPANWLHVGFIRLILPNAKIIDARRHPMAVGFSNFKQHYASGLTFAYSQESIGRYYFDYLRMMRHFDRVQPGAVHHVINERLIDDPEGEIRRLLDFVGIPFDSACLEFHKNRRAVRTPSAAQVRRGISREGVDQWRNYEPWLGPLKEALGSALEGWDR